MSGSDQKTTRENQSEGTIEKHKSRTADIGADDLAVVRDVAYSRGFNAGFNAGDNSNAEGLFFAWAVTATVIAIASCASSCSSDQNQTSDQVPRRAETSCAVSGVDNIRAPYRNRLQESGG